MITIIGMRMVVCPAKTVIQKMCEYDQDDGRYKEPVLIFGKKLFQYQENKPGEEYDQGQPVMMMLSVTMVKRKGANA